MKNVMRSFFVGAIAALLVASATVPSEAARRAARSTRAFDGTWSVVIQTLRGDCDPTLRAAVRIYSGRVYADDPSYQAYGAVGSGGAIRVTLVRGNQSAGGAGRLRGNVGSGWWRTASGQCSGRWTAERRFANY